jgi:hypothetical protein
MLPNNRFEPTSGTLRAPRRLNRKVTRLHTPLLHDAVGNSMARTTLENNDITASLGFEAKPCAAADALRDNVDAAEYEHVVLGLSAPRPTIGTRVDGAMAARASLEGVLPKDHARPGLDKQRLGQIIDIALPDLKADCLLANPPFNDGELLKDERRWVCGTPAAGNVNHAWARHFIRHWAPPAVASSSGSACYGGAA